MRDEISAAVCFLAHLIEKGENCNDSQLEEFKKQLSDLLVERFQDHWFPEQPNKGQGYRCIRLNENVPKDAVLEQAAHACGLKYEDLNLPLELTLWVDPKEVCCRFGEHRGSYCTLASFNDEENSEVTTKTLDSDEKEETEEEALETTEDVTPPVSNVESTIPSAASTNIVSTSSSSPKKPNGGRGSPKHRKSGLRSSKNWSYNVMAGFVPYQQRWQTMFPPTQWLAAPPPVAFPPAHAIFGSPPNVRWGEVFHNSPFRFHWNRPTLKV